MGKFSYVLIAVYCLMSLLQCGYLTPQHVEQHIKRLISQRYQLYVINLGQTVNNNPLKAYVISGIKKQQSSINQLLHYPATLITSYMHPREPYSVKLIETVLDEVLNNYNTDYYFKYMLDNTLLILFPFVNIDGYYLYQQLVEENASKMKRQSYRKNLNKYGKCAYDWQYGVDINRNFDSSWGSLRTSDIQCGQQYRGPKPFSQKQSRAIRTLFTKFKITLSIDIHSYGNQWIYPYASQRTNEKFFKHQLYPLYQDLFDEFKKFNRSMKGCFESLGYTADGVYIDWALDQGALSLAVQIGKAFDGDVDVGNQMLFETQSLFHTVLRKNSISYRKYFNPKENLLIIKSTSLLSFDVQVFMSDGQSLGLKNLQSMQWISYKISDAQNIENKLKLKVLDTQIVEDIKIAELEKIESIQEVIEKDNKVMNKKSQTKEEKEDLLQSLNINDSTIVIVVVVGSISVVVLTFICICVCCQNRTSVSIKVGSSNEMSSANNIDQQTNLKQLSPTSLYKQTISETQLDNSNE